MRKIGKSAFTLIELLAVITIMGILMIIAIPSITAIIDNARKDTLFNTMDAYIESLKLEVMDGTYQFLDSNETVYAVPIECIALEQGGKNPYGEWLQANDDYWAYVLVQYDTKTENYTYGFTYKDTVGWSLYPTNEENFDDPDTKIMKYLDVYKPRTGLFSNIAGVKDWAGFELEHDTPLIVLESETDGVAGDGRTTCTLATKGPNYGEVEEAKRLKNMSDKACSFTLGTGSAVGDILTCGAEEFYLLKKGDEAYTFFAKEQIDVTTDKPKQNALAEGTYFTDIKYWLTSAASNTPSAKFGGKYPLYAYGNYLGNNIYKYLRAYEDYLENDLGVKSASTTMMSYNETISLLKCEIRDNPNNPYCESSPYIDIIKRDYYWFLGTVYDSYNIYTYAPDTDRIALTVPTPYFHFKFGIRPLVVIAVDDIQF